MAVCKLCGGTVGRHFPMLDDRTLVAIVEKQEQTNSVFETRIAELEQRLAEAERRLSVVEMQVLPIG